MTGRFADREHLRGGLDRGTIAAHAGRDACRRHQVDVGFLLQDVARQRQEHRAGRRRERGLAGAMHHQRQILQPMHLVRPLHQRPRDRRQVRIQDRFGAVEILIVLAGSDENGRGGLLRVVEHAHRVAEAGRDMQVHHRELAGRLRVAVGHRHHDGLLQAEHVAHVVSTANASISGSSVVPGLPNNTSTPSCFRISRNARFPEMTGKVSSAFFE